MGRERRTYTIDGEDVAPAEWRAPLEPGIVRNDPGSQLSVGRLGSEAT